MTGTQTPNELQDRANELQKEANKLQQEMIAETKENNTVTSDHNSAIKRLTFFIVLLGTLTVLLGILTIWTNLNKTGRYAISTGQGGKTFVLDTKTSQLWIRTTSANAYLGTNENPMFEKISSEK